MKDTLTPEDAAAFRAAMAQVRPRPPSTRAPMEHSTPSTRPRSREADEHAVIEELTRGPIEPDPLESVDAPSFRAPGIQDGVWRRLRRGSYRIGAELDLHGLNRERAHRAVADFIANCHEGGIRCVRIIHGKGLGSPNSGPILRGLLDGWLRRRRDVLAFCPARPQDGGTGAVYVLLRAADRK